MKPPRTVTLTALYLAIHFRALLEGLKPGQVRYGTALPQNFMCRRMVCVRARASRSLHADSFRAR